MSFKRTYRYRWLPIILDRERSCRLWLHEALPISELTRWNAEGSSCTLQTRAQASGNPYLCRCAYWAVARGDMKTVGTADRTCPIQFTDAWGKSSGRNQRLGPDESCFQRTRRTDLWTSWAPWSTFCCRLTRAPSPPRYFLDASAVHRRAVSLQMGFVDASIAGNLYIARSTESHSPLDLWEHTFLKQLLPPTGRSPCCLLFASIGRFTSRTSKHAANTARINEACLFYCSSRSMLLRKECNEPLVGNLLPQIFVGIHVRPEDGLHCCLGPRTFEFMLDKQLEINTSCPRRFSEYFLYSESDCRGFGHFEHRCHYILNSQCTRLEVLKIPSWVALVLVLEILQKSLACTVIPDFKPIPTPSTTPRDIVMNVYRPSEIYLQST